MKYIKINDDLLEKINKGEIKEIAIVNDKDEISLDEVLEFFNSENVAFGKARVIQLRINKLGDFEDEQELIKYLISEYDRVSLSSNDHVKVITFEYERYKEPKSLSTNTELDVTSIKIYSDGGSRGNPGPSASGYVLLTEDDKIGRASCRERVLWYV